MPIRVTVNKLLIPNQIFETLFHPLVKYINMCTNRF